MSLSMGPVSSLGRKDGGGGENWSIEKIELTRLDYYVPLFCAPSSSP